MESGGGDDRDNGFTTFRLFRDGGKLRWKVRFPFISDVAQLGDSAAPK